MEYISKEDVKKIIEDIDLRNPQYGLMDKIISLKTYKGIKKVAVEPLFCPQDCCYLALNEDEQDEWAEHGYELHHMCSKYYKEVVHGSYAPELIRVEGCEEL